MKLSKAKRTKLNLKKVEERRELIKPKIFNNIFSICKCSSKSKVRLGNKIETKVRKNHSLK